MGGGEVGREPCGTEMGTPAVHEPDWGLPDQAHQAELSTELHPGIFFFNQNV